MPELASLPLFHRVAGQRERVHGDGPAAEAKRRLVERAGRRIATEMQGAIDEGVRLAFVAFEDAKACEVAAINLRCAGMLVNVVDRPDLCDFTTPSVLDRNPLLIAIGTGGASAGLAKHVRLRLERLLPASLGRLAEGLFAARPRLRERFPDGTERRRAIDAALGEGGTLDPLDPASHERVADWVEGVAETKPPFAVEFEIHSDDPEDLTLRQARLLGEADRVCADATVSPAILARARADAQRVTCDGVSCLANGRPACMADVSGSEGGGLTVILRRENAAG
ncbi:MAG: siroheme synthase [Erythrobacter sp.]